MKSGLLEISRNKSTNHSLPLYIVQNMRRALNFHEQDYIRNTYLLVCIRVVSFYMKSELLKISRNKSTNLVNPGSFVLASFNM